MTFAEIQTEILDRLNYTSSTASTRVGRLINKIYKQVGTEIGLDFARRAAASRVVTVGNASVTFTGVEHIERVWYEDSSGNPHMLDSVLIGELRNEAAVSSDKPTIWALYSTASNTVTIRLDAKPETAYTLNCDGITEVADLSGSNEPAFSESYHDIIIEGVLREEYTKLEKPSLADRAEAAYEKRLSGLRMFQAKNGYLDIYQGKQQESNSRRNTSGGSSASLGTTALTITALWTFTRGSAVAPFAVSNTDATYVANLGAEFLGNITTDRLIGRDTTGTGETEQLTVGGGIEFTGSGGIQTSALTGDVTKAAGGTATTIAASAVETAMIEDDAVTYAKMQNIATDSLIGRDTAATGSPETIGLNATLSMDGAGNLQRAALTGDVTASAGSNATTIANDVVTYAKMQDVAANSFLARAAGTSGDVSAVALAASQLAGRGSAGNVTAITLGSGLSMSSDTLSSTATDTTTQLTAVRVYTASDTWSKPAGLYAIVVQVLGGGGAGGGTALTGAAQCAAANGGAGGGGSIKRIAAASLGATETVTIGAGGTAGTAGNNAGNAGGTTSFGAHLSATGGSGGAGDAAATPPVNNSTAPPSPGVGSSGDLNFTGSPGGRGFTISAVYALSGGGGSSSFGGGGKQVYGATGEAGTNYGAGGSGSSATQNEAARAGGAGTAGIVIVYEYVTA